MALTSEEQRALEYQASERRRVGFLRSLQAKLKAPPGPAQQVKERWEPIINRERRFTGAKRV